MAVKKPQVLIVGAGLGGLTLAQALRKQGISFEIFERSSNEDRFQGWAIGLHSIIGDLIPAFPNDMPPLATTDHLLPLDLPAQITFYYGDGIHPRFGVQDPGDKSIVRSNRQRLRSWLATNIDIQYSKVATAVEESEDSVTVHFRDGSSATGDIVVGADGVHSAVRQHLFSVQGTPDPMNILPIGIVVGEVTLHDHDMERQLELGYSSYFAGPSSAPPDSGRLFVGLNSVNPDGRSGNYYWFMVYQDEAMTRQPYWTASASKEELLQFAREKTAYMDPRFREVIEKTQPEGIVTPAFIFRDMEIERLPVGRVTLLGDAAHCMVPFRGEGGVHALMDSLKLARAITEITTHPNENSLKRLLGEYQEEMLERAGKAVRGSRNAFRPGTAGETAGEGRVAWGMKAFEIPYKEVSLADIPRAK